MCPYVRRNNYIHLFSFILQRVRTYAENRIKFFCDTYRHTGVEDFFIPDEEHLFKGTLGHEFTAFRVLAYDSLRICAKYMIKVWKWCEKCTIIK